MNGGLFLLLFLALVQRVASTTFSYTGGPSIYQSINSSGTLVVFPSGYYSNPAIYAGAAKQVTSPYSFDFGSDSSMTISSGASFSIMNNGEIYFGTQTSLSQRLLTNFSVELGRIAVFNCPSFVAGNVYYLIKDTSIIFSFEGMKITSSSVGLSAQAEVHVDGRIELRYSTLVSLSSQQCVAGISDYSATAPTYQAINYG